MFNNSYTDIYSIPVSLSLSVAIAFKQSPPPIFFLPSRSWYANFQCLWFTRRTGQLKIFERLIVGNPANATSLANLWPGIKWEANSKPVHYCGFQALANQSPNIFCHHFQSFSTSQGSNMFQKTSVAHVGVSARPALTPSSTSRCWG